MFVLNPPPFCWMESFSVCRNEMFPCLIQEPHICYQKERRQPPIKELTPSNEPWKELTSPGLYSPFWSLLGVSSTVRFNLCITRPVWSLLSDFLSCPHLHMARLSFGSPSWWKPYHHTLTAEHSKSPSSQPRPHVASLALGWPRVDLSLVCS
jgi:hypothetical protein